MAISIKKFEHLCKTYEQKRSFFKKIIDRFEAKRKRKMHTQCLNLFNEAEALYTTLKDSVTLDNLKSKEIQKKIKTFKGAYQELHTITKPVWLQWTEALAFALLAAFILRNFFFGLYHVPTGSAEKTILVGDRIWGNKMAYYFSKTEKGDLVIFDNPTFEYDRSSYLGYLWQKYIGLPVPLLGVPGGCDQWVKRVIARPGDVIEGRIEEGKTVIYLNGKKLDEPYVNKLPLITVEKTRGFLPWKTIGGILSIPSFLQQETGIRHYTYDPQRTLAEQPFYSINEDEVVKKTDGSGPLLVFPFTPTYDHQTGLCYDIFGPYTVPAGKYWVMGDSRKNSADSRWWLFLDENLIHGRASFIIYSIDSEEVFWLFDLIKHPIDFWTKHVRWSRFLNNVSNSAQKQG